MFPCRAADAEVMERWWESDRERHGISGLGNPGVLSASDYAAELGGRGGHAKRGKALWRQEFLLGERAGEWKLLQTLLALGWCATERPAGVWKPEWV